MVNTFPLASSTWPLPHRNWKSSFINGTIGEAWWVWAEQKPSFNLSASKSDKMQPESVIVSYQRPISKDLYYIARQHLPHPPPVFQWVSLQLLPSSKEYSCAPHESWGTGCRWCRLMQFLVDGLIQPIWKICSSILDHFPKYGIYNKEKLLRPPTCL